MAPRLITSVRGVRSTVDVFFDPEFQVYSLSHVVNGKHHRAYTTSERLDALVEARAIIDADNERRS